MGSTNIDLYMFKKTGDFEGDPLAGCLAHAFDHCLFVGWKRSHKGTCEKKPQGFVFNQAPAENAAGLNLIFVDRKLLHEGEEIVEGRNV